MALQFQVQVARLSVGERERGERNERRGALQYSSKKSMQQKQISPTSIVAQLVVTHA